MNSMNSLINMTLEWQFPLVVSAVYVSVVKYWNTRNATCSSSKVGAKAMPSKQPLKKKEAKTFFDYLVILHNLALMIFSLVTFVKVVPILVSNYMALPIKEAFCDLHGTIWRGGLQYWSYWFYISKYYEIVDTMIILLKGKQSSFLQTFHHTGAILTMFLLVKYDSFGAFIFVTCNSFIHTIMYTYYCLTCLGYQPSWKQLLTRMQIGQFIIGLTLGLLTAFVPGCIDYSSEKGKAQYWAIVINMVYVTALVFLFNNFAKKTYANKAKSQ